MSSEVNGNILSEDVQKLSSIIQQDNDPKHAKSINCNLVDLLKSKGRKPSTTTEHIWS